MSLCAALLLAALAGEDATTLETVKWSAVRKGYWSVEASVAVPRAKTPLCQLARETLLREERRDFTEFLASAKTEVPWVKKSMRDAEYSYVSTVRLRRNDKRFLSFQSERYVYTAGAHGNGWIKSWNFGFVGGKAKEVHVWDTFRSDPSSRGLLERLLLAESLKEEGAMWVQDGTVRGFDDGQLDNFWVGGDGLNWEFAPYALGPYASGPFTLSLSWAELRPVLKPGGPLEPFVAKSR